MKELKAQGTGGVCLLTDAKYEFYYPLCLALTEEDVPIAEAKADRKARTKPDYQISYDRQGVIDLFEESPKDKTLDFAIDYIEDIN